MYKHKITRRKFYGKWLYKVSLKVPGIAVLRSMSLNDTIDFLKTNQTEEKLKFYSHKKAYSNKEDITNLCQFLALLDVNDWSKRIELNNIDLYTNTSEIYNKLINNFQHALTLCSSPDLSRVEEYTDQNHVICKKLPHNRYRYKIYLKPHVMKNDREGKQDYVSWLESQKNVLISDVVKNWFIHTDWNWDRRYILVEDHKTLLFLHMRNSEVLGKIYEYVISDK